MYPPVVSGTIVQVLNEPSPCRLVLYRCIHTHRIQRFRVKYAHQYYQLSCVLFQQSILFFNVKPISLQYINFKTYFCSYIVDILNSSYESIKPTIAKCSALETSYNYSHKVYQLQIVHGIYLYSLLLQDTLLNSNPLLTLLRKQFV